METLTDEELMHQVKLGNPNSLGIIFEKHHKHIFNFLYKMSGDKVLSEDITQEVFLKLHKHSNTYKQGKFLPWLFTIARNTLSTHYTRNKETHSSLDMVHINKEEEIDDFPDNDDFLMLYRALEKLNPTDKELLVLHKMQDLNYTEIAMIMSSTTGAVKTKTFRALKKLKEIYFKIEQR